MTMCVRVDLRDTDAASTQALGFMQTDTHATNIHDDQEEAQTCATALDRAVIMLPYLYVSWARWAESVSVCVCV